MDKFNDLISIVTASYNYEDYIKETIESVIAQSYQNWELIIVDDGSKDNSINVINEYCQKDSRIKLYTHENNSNKGLAQTLQYGIKLSSGKYVAFLESDDTITPDCLEKKANVISENPNIALIFNDINLFGYEEKIRGFDYYINRRKEILNSKNYPANILKEMDIFNLISTFSSVMVRKDILEKLDFNSPIKASLDYYLWLQVVQQNSVYYVDEKLTNWRMHKDSYSNELRKPTSKADLDLELLKNKFILYKNPIKRFLKNAIAYSIYFRRICFKWHPKERMIMIFGKTFNY
ncbi:MAG: glycosyltransferase family 2 protein [Candidatus Gastranaerophilaceae bacterium]